MRLSQLCGSQTGTGGFSHQLNRNTIQAGSLRTVAEKNGLTVVWSTFRLYDAAGRMRMRAVLAGKAGGLPDY
ncbi:MAG TPA: hypothetical protein VMF06_01170 [Candidatus Limnocylindria bacterium]|nr:hypothetical protein [Candidatus Limnocylindria bacterium]